MRIKLFTTVDGGGGAFKVLLHQRGDDNDIK